MQRYIENLQSILLFYRVKDICMISHQNIILYF